MSPPRTPTEDGSLNSKEEENVTVTHFSWGQEGRLEQRLVSPTPTSPTPFLSLPLNTESTNPFTNPFARGEVESPTSPAVTTPTNPFLTNVSNPFVESIEKGGVDKMGGAHENLQTRVEVHATNGIGSYSPPLSPNVKIITPTSPLLIEKKLSESVPPPSTIGVKSPKPAVRQTVLNNAGKKVRNR